MIVLSEPGGGAVDAVLEWCGGGEAGGGGEGRGVGVGLVNVAWLHGEKVFPGLFAGGSLDAFDVVHEARWVLIADIVNGGGHLGCRQHIYYPHNAFDYVVDIGKVAEHVAVVEHFDGLVVENSIHEQEWRHVGPSPRAIYSKEAQSRCRQPVEFAVNIGHQLVALLGSCIN